MKKMLWLICCVLTLAACNNTATQTEPTPKAYALIGGRTMGTTYSVKFEGTDAQQVEAELNQLFVDINKDVSTYIDNSFISLFNKNKISKIDQNDLVKHPHFTTNYIASKDIYRSTAGMFDPTVMPLVNYWGFGYDGKKKVTEVDKKQITSMLKYVGFDLIQSTHQEGKLTDVEKKDSKVKLDMSAIAKGYAADQAAQLLDSKGIENYLVEVGGEVVTKGISNSGKAWTIGINTPKEGAAVHDFKAYIALSGKGMATSGNYRNFYKVGDQVFSHTINPKTGLPERSNLLSATVIAKECMIADGYATACMVAGLDKAFEMVNNNPTLEGYFIYSDENGQMKTKQTSGFPQYLLKE